MFFRTQPYKNKYTIRIIHINTQIYKIQQIEINRHRLICCQKDSPKRRAGGGAMHINNKFSEGITQIPIYSYSYIRSSKYFDLHNSNTCLLPPPSYCWTSTSSLIWLKYGWSQNWLKSTARYISIQCLIQDILGVKTLKFFPNFQ